MRTKKSLQFSSILMVFFVFSFLFNAQAQTTYIWYIGKIHDKGATPSKEVIEYLVPENWYELLGQDDPDWGEFPPELYSDFDKDKKPQEIRINFDYPKDYINPELRIVARIKSVVSNGVYHHLIIYKGEKISIGSDVIRDFFVSFDFPVGYLKKGLHDENRIIIKVESSSDIPIVFDSLKIRLNETDSDGDGVSDYDEGDLSISNDKVTTAIPIKSYYPKDIERIILHIEGAEGSSLCFRDVRFLDTNSLNLPLYLLSNHYLPYGFLGFRIEEIVPIKQIDLLICFEDILYPSVRFFTYQDTNVWEEINFNILDVNSANISLNDGGRGDFDGQKNGSIRTKLFLAYPRGLDVHLDKTGCFIEGIFTR